MGGVYTWGNIISIDLQWLLIKIPKGGGGGEILSRHPYGEILIGHIQNGPHERRVELSQDMYARCSMQSVGTPWPSHVAAKLANI